MTPTTKHQHTSRPHGLFIKRSALAALCFCGLSASITNAQTAGAATSEQVVALPSFEVKAQTDDSYTGKEAMSTTRTGVALQDLAQSVVVVNKEFLNDLKPTYIADIMKHVGGGQTGTLTWTGSTRYTMRGYTSEGNFVDGFAFPGGNTSFAWTDRVEIIKGPAAIFVSNAANTVGGMVNKISKSPTSYHVGEISAEAALFDRGAVSIDYGGPVTADQKLQYRVVSSYNDYSRYWNRDGGDRRFSVMPMVAYDFSPDTRAWIKYERHTQDFGGYEGIPLDGRTGQMAVLPDGDKGNLHEDTPLNYRHTDYDVVWGQLTSRLSDFVAMRLAGFASWTNGDSIRSVTTPSGATDPTLQPNGTWIYSPYPQYVIPPNYVAGQLIPRNTTASITDDRWREVQNDYVFTFNTGPVKNTLLVGGTLRATEGDTFTYSSSGTSTATSSAVDPFNPSFPGTVFVNWDQPPANTQLLRNSMGKWYALETATLFDDRLILTYGVSRNRFALSSTSQNYNQRTAVTSAPTIVPQTKLTKDLVQYSALFKVLPNVSLFYGFNANFAANAINNGAFPPPQEGSQKEIGLKTQWMNGRLGVSVAYFDIEVLNNPIKTFPQTTPPTEVLVPGILSTGFDGDFSFAVTENFLLIGSFSFVDAEAGLNAPHSLAQQPYDGSVRAKLPVNNISDKNASLWGRYKFHTGTLKGLSIGAGLTYSSKRAITDNANFMLYGYIPGRTLVDMNLNYETERFSYQLRVDNVLNKDYIHAARSNQVIVPGYPTNVGGSVTFKF